MVVRKVCHIFVEQTNTETKTQMTNSIHQVFTQVVEQENIDLNSPYKLERRLCISRMFDLIDMSTMNVYEAKLFVENVENFVNMIFDSTNSRREEMLTNIKGGLDPELPF